MAASHVKWRAALYARRKELMDTETFAALRLAALLEQAEMEHDPDGDACPCDEISELWDRLNVEIHVTGLWEA